MKKILLTILGTIFAFGLLSPLALAEGSAEIKFDLNSIRFNQNGKKQNAKYLEKSEAEGMSPIVAFILEVTEMATMVIGSVALLVLIGAGIMMIVNIGNEQSVTHAKSMFLYSILGLVFAFSAYFIIVFVQGLFVEV